MAKLIYSAITSLDGYVEDSGGSFDWATPDREVFAFINDLERPDADRERLRARGDWPAQGVLGSRHHGRRRRTRGRGHGRGPGRRVPPVPQPGHRGRRTARTAGGAQLRQRRCTPPLRGARGTRLTITD